MGEIAYAVKSCFAGLVEDGFDFIVAYHDFINLTEKERIVRRKTDLFSLSVDIRVWDFPITCLTDHARCSHLAVF